MIDPRPDLPDHYRWEPFLHLLKENFNVLLPKAIDIRNKGCLIKEDRKKNCGFRIDPNIPDSEYNEKQEFIDDMGEFSNLDVLSFALDRLKFMGY